MKLKRIIAGILGLSLAFSSAALTVSAESAADFFGNDIWGEIFNDIPGSDEDGNLLIDSIFGKDGDINLNDEIISLPENIAPDDDISSIIKIDDDLLTEISDILSQLPEEDGEIWKDGEVDINDLTGIWEPYKFIFEIYNTVTEYIESNPDIDCRDLKTDLDPENPENSILSMTVGDETAKETIENYLAGLGYSQDLLDIIVDADFIDTLLVMLGDINLSGTVDVTDLSELSLALLGDRTLTEEQLGAADINGNGKADLADLARMRQFLSKIITSLGFETDSE